MRFTIDASVHLNALDRDLRAELLERGP